MIRAGAIGMVIGCALMVAGLWSGVMDAGTYDNRAQAGGGLIGFILSGGIIGLAAGLGVGWVTRK